LELLTPIFHDYADLIEGVLPPKLRLTWRKAAPVAPQIKGRKTLDHRACCSGG